MDVSVLPAGAQAQMATLSIDSGVISSLTGAPAPSGTGGGLFATPAVTVDISEEARAAALAADENSPGPGWELGYDPTAQTGYDTGEDASSDELLPADG
jgi:hypothetical protein